MQKIAVLQRERKSKAATTTRQKKQQLIAKSIYKLIEIPQYLVSLYFGNVNAISHNVRHQSCRHRIHEHRHRLTMAALLPDTRHGYSALALVVGMFSGPSVGVSASAFRNRLSNVRVVVLLCPNSFWLLTPAVLRTG